MKLEVLEFEARDQILMKITPSVIFPRDQWNLIKRVSSGWQHSTDHENCIDFFWTFGKQIGIFTSLSTLTEKDPKTFQCYFRDHMSIAFSVKNFNKIPLS